MTDAKRMSQFNWIYRVCYALLLLVIVFLLVRIFNPPGVDPNQLNKAINERNSQYAKANSYGFTDKERTPKKSNGTYRIAVLGDSFIWGDGMPYEKVWSHKLETKLLAQYDSIEVMHWGHNGWSTLDELNFYKTHGKDYEIDLLIIAWVDNDLDIGKIPPVNAMDPAKEMPILNKICPPFAEAWIGHKEDVAYAAWLKKIYEPQNLNEYRAVLNDFKLELLKNNTQALYIMTPGPFDETEQQHFTQMEPVLRSSGIPCLNLYNSMYQKLHHFSNTELIANPVNGHPGEKMIEEISTEVKVYLERSGYLHNIPQKR